MEKVRRSFKSSPATAGLVVLLALLLASTVARASGWPPFATGDSAEVNRGGTVEVLTNGARSVLDNDFDFERDQLTAVLTKDVKHGTLLLRSDGTFRYQHDGGKDDDDEFKYKAFDGTGESREATVEIEIQEVPNSPPFVVSDVPDQQATEGSEFRLNLSPNFSDPDDADVLSFSVKGLPSSGSLQIGEQSGVISGSPAAADVRDNAYSVEVTATDRFGEKASLKFDLLVLRKNAPPVVVGQVPDQQAIEGIAFRLNLAGNFDDPDDGDILRFSARGLPASRSLQINPTSALISGTPVAADVRDEPYTVSVTATDRAGATATVNFQLQVFPDNRSDVVLDVGAASNPVTVGEDSQWNISIRNKGPADLQDGQLLAVWVTSGPSLTVAAPEECVVADNGTSAPTMECSLAAVDAGATIEINVQSVQDGDGDNSLIGVVNADDPNPGDNQDLASTAVVAEFSEGATQIVDVSGAALQAGDLDQDGAVDIVASGAETFVFFNGGNRAVTEPGVSLGPDSGGSALAILDWNGDGSQDIAVGGLETRAFEVFINDGGGGFASGTIRQSFVGVVGDMLAADFDGDGAHELLATGTAGTSLLSPGPQGDFDTKFIASDAGRDLAIADLDQDGDQDFVVVLDADRIVEIHYNDGAGSFASVNSLDFGSVANVSVSDLNGDGAADLLLAVDGDDMNAPQNKVLYQQGSGEFSPGPSFGASPVTDLVTGDINADGRSDIVAVNEAGVHQLYLGSQGNEFTLAREQIVSAGMRRGILTDFNNDDSLDLILAGADASVLEIHANNGIGRLGLGDRVSPEIELMGEADVTIPAGQVYTDPGATAVDDIDGDISEKIEVTGTVNSSVVGAQTITYSVADRAGNRASATRTVTVGVNEGSGGGGGGLLTPFFVMTLMILFVAYRVRRTD